jgi:hypothetical protein
MMRPPLDIFAEIHARHTSVFTLNANGPARHAGDPWRDCARRLQDDGSVSFDGVGFHDWMRQCTDTQAHATRAMGSCVENGFGVVSDIQVSRRNVCTSVRL